MPTTRYDAIVIGAGQGGGPLATALAAAGRRTALIEREHVGWHVRQRGLHADQDDGRQRPGRLSRPSRRRLWRDDRRGRRRHGRGRERGSAPSSRASAPAPSDGLKRRLVWTSSDGEARFTGPASLVVARDDGTLDIAAELIVHQCRRPPSAARRCPGSTRVPALDSTSIMELDTVPEHLLVLGGGYVGLEFGQMFRRFGSRVTIVQRGPRLLAREDADVADAVADDPARGRHRRPARD